MWDRRPFVRWLGYALFFASVWALLGTSPSRWRLSATVIGPSAASPGRGLELTTTSSAEPSVSVAGLKSTLSQRLPCLSPWSPGTRVACLVPPGVTVDEVFIGDHCSPGCCSGPCVPPPGAYVNAESREVDVWKEAVSSKLTSVMPQHDRGSVGTGFKALVEGAEIIEVRLEVSPLSGAPVFYRLDETCRRDGAGPGPLTCHFLVDDGLLPYRPLDVNIVAQATGWGRCAAPPCKPPGTLRVLRIEVVK
jgi:hypothetical protein